MTTSPPPVTDDAAALIMMLENAATLGETPPPPSLPLSGFKDSKSAEQQVVGSDLDLFKSRRRC